jgi:hypothetical protein
MTLTRSEGAATDAPFDLDRLRPEERDLWQKHFTGPDDDGPVVRVWSFGYACMLELWGPPTVVTEWLEQNDPNNLTLQYLENVRRAREQRRL